MKNLLPEDIARRLVRRAPCWFNGKPKVKLVGQVGEFGILVFSFGGWLVSWEIYIADRGHILETAREAIEDFPKLIERDGC